MSEEKKIVKEQNVGVQQSPEKADPFARLQKKKIARPKSMTQVMKWQVKKWSKISPKRFLLGCGTLFLLFLWIAFGGLFYAVNSSASALESIGLTIEDVKSILLIFAAVFFGVIFFLWFYLFVLNIYRLVTVKWKKIPYIAWLWWWTIILLCAIVFGTLSINRINQLSWTQSIQSNNLVLSYVITKWWSVFFEQWIPLIAPMRLRFEINQVNNADISRDIRASLERNAPLNVSLDCGNGQVLPMRADGQFAGNCLFLEKAQYVFTLLVQTQDGVQEYSAWWFNMNAGIELEALDDTSYLNDNKTEYIIGIAPVTVKFVANKLFTDLGLSQDAIEWDMDNDGKVDLKDNANFQYPFGDSKQHVISYRLPQLSRWSDVWFTFDLRVIESDLASCTLDIVEKDVLRRRYSITPKFDELVDVGTYHYTVYDTLEETIVDTLKESKDTTSYTFPKGWMYEVQASYFTKDGKKWTCASETLDVGFDGNQVNFDLKRKTVQNEPFQQTGEGTNVLLDTQNKIIAVTSIPTILEFTITDILPDPTASLRVFLEGREIFAVREDVYELTLTSLWEKDLVFETTTRQGAVSEQFYTIDVSRASVKAMMEVQELVGEDPFEVTLDASISPLYDENDEIVFFTWDFGDGTTRENVSQWVVKHTYRFDEESNTGVYYPRVTIRTKLGYEDSYKLDTPITVKRKQKEANIRVDSHPTQQARVWDRVSFALETDGRVERIDRDFGNGKKFGCDDRSCAESSMLYTQPWEYLIKTEIQYTNETPVVGRVRIKVYE